MFLGPFSYPSLPDLLSSTRLIESISAQPLNLSEILPG